MEVSGPLPPLLDVGRLVDSPCELGEGTSVPEIRRIVGLDESGSSGLELLRNTEEWIPGRRLLFSRVWGPAVRVLEDMGRSEAIAGDDCTSMRLVFASSSVRGRGTGRRLGRTVRRNEEMPLVKRFCHPQLKRTEVIAFSVSFSVTITMSFLFGKVWRSHFAGSGISERNHG